MKDEQHLPIPTAEEESLQTLVGEVIYGVWLDMLSRLGRDGRSHRLSVIVAGMLQYSAVVAGESYGHTPPPRSVAARLLGAVEWGDPDETIASLRQIVTRLFDEAGVPHVRHNRRGVAYDLVESSVDEFVHWHSFRGESKWVS